jgi:hypothetical protein
LRLSHAANTLIPAIKALRAKGYKVRVDSENRACTAERNGNQFNAQDPVTVLGLVTLYEVLGDEWQLPDRELMELGHEYGFL